MSELQITRKCAMFKGDELLARWQTGAELARDEAAVLILYLNELKKAKPDPATAAGRLAVLLSELAVERRPCKLCAEPLYFLRAPDGKKVAYTVAGVNHLQNCDGRQGGEVT